MRTRLFVVLILLAPFAGAHPLVEHALEVVIHPTKVAITARIAPEQVRLIEWGNDDPASAAERHGEYVLEHLHVQVDGRAVAGSVIASLPPAAAPATTTTPATAAPTTATAYTFRLEYPLASPPPGVVQIEQDFLREQAGWSAGCVVKVRQSDQPEFDTALLPRYRKVVFDCDWQSSAAKVRPDEAVAATGVRVGFWRTVGEYFVYGTRHIVGWDEQNHMPAGLDHILFVCALVLAARSVWDVVKVVTAFTLAHTLTLTLSVLKAVTVSQRVVEPMIAASIVCVALQNVLWPASSRGWARLGLAFAFGLFHGLGFAGGLREAMSDLPGTALGAALTGFSLGVEMGHQIVVIPLFALLWSVRRRAESGRRAAAWVMRWGSAGISVAGVFFLVKVVKELY
jgi:hypothetical protein